MSATMHPDGKDPGAAMLDDGLAAQVPAVVLLLVGCAALSAFIVLRKAERP